LNLTVGITKDLVYWNILLRQVGISYTIIDWKDDLLNHYSVIIVNSFLGKDETQKILKFVEVGGSLLSEADFSESIFKITTKQVYLKYLFSDEKIFGYHLPIIDLYRNCSIPSSADLLNDQNGKPTVSVFKRGKGNVIIIPGNFISAVSDDRVLRKKIYSLIKESPTERVSKVSKGSICHFLRISIEYLFHKKNLPFISLWNFPGSSKNIFAFRIDTDYGSQKQVDLLYKTIIGNNVKGTWFVETQSQEKWIYKYSSFANQEIGLHCYRHRVFNSYRQNYNNLKKGLEVLRKVSIIPKGVAAPFGEWNSSFSKAVEDNGFEYSSEFAFSYDNFPQIADEKNEILQIPVHPISFGRLLRAVYNDNEMYEYFVNVINQKIALCEPVIIYTHPQEERYDIHKRIFNFVNEMDLYKITFYEYAQWWKKRNLINYSASLINNEIKTESEIKDETIWLKTVYPSKEIYLMSLSGNKKIKMDLPEFKYDSNFNPDMLRTYTYRMFKDDILFHMRKKKL